jgi:hypothetical protein
MVIGERAAAAAGADAGGDLTPAAAIDSDDDGFKAASSRPDHKHIGFAAVGPSAAPSSPGDAVGIVMDGDVRSAAAATTVDNDEAACR